MLFIVFLKLLNICRAEIDLEEFHKMEEGENNFKILQTNLSPYGECWNNALQDLHLGCKHLSEEVQGRLALSFTNCFMKHSLTIECPCSNEKKISECLPYCPSEVFNTYTQFFTHTQSICHYLQHRAWQEKTERTVNSLTENAEIVSQKLDEASVTQSKIIDLQQTSFEEQQKLILNGRALSAELQKSRNHAKSVFEDFKSTTSEQRLLIFEVFDRIKSLQSFVLGEFTSIFTIAYYIVGIIVIYILTSVPSTSKARIWLLMILTINAACERALASYSIDEELLKLLPLDVKGPMFTRIWLCRKFASFLSIGVLLYFHFTFEDYNIINNKLLKEIQQQNLDLQNFLQSIKLGEFTSTPLNASNLKPLITSSIKKKIEKRTFEFKSANDSFEDKENLTKPTITPRKNKVLVEKTPKQISKDIRKNTPKKNVVQSVLGNKSLDENQSSQKRYNLRSRTNSPMQSSYSNQSPKIHDFEKASDLLVKSF